MGATVAAPGAEKARLRRRDDSLLQVQDGIQSYQYSAWSREGSAQAAGRLAAAGAGRHPELSIQRRAIAHCKRSFNTSKGPCADADVVPLPVTQEQPCMHDG
jgi:hypothetical protein